MKEQRGLGGSAIHSGFKEDQDQGGRGHGRPHKDKSRSSVLGAARGAPPRPAGRQPPSFAPLPRSLARSAGAAAAAAAAGVRASSAPAADLLLGFRHGVFHALELGIKRVGGRLRLLAGGGVAGGARGGGRGEAAGLGTQLHAATLW